MTISKELKLISEVVDLLDSYGEFYKRISKNKYGSYEDYITKGDFVDEERLVRPEFLRDFTQKILAFTTGTLSYQDPDSPSGERPDAIPFDTRVHPLVIETKGSDSDDLTRHFGQLKKYIDGYGVKWGIVFNLRECIVFSAPTDFPVVDLRLSFIDLYRRYGAYQRKETKSLLDYENTKAFLSFVKRFSKKEISQTDKIQKIAEAKDWTGLETLDPDVLTNEIREVVKILHDDVKEKRSEIGGILGLNPVRREKIAREIDSIAGDIDPKKPQREVTNKTLSTLLNAKPGTLDHQAVDSYFYRVAYFTMTKILLVRAWEDIGFIDQTLYDGGFKDCYERMRRKLDEVLDYAFHLAGRRYSWLFNIENSYTWYAPSENSLIEVLYLFSNFNLSLLSTDVLGYVYEEYLDITDRKNKGQYYTPREIIRFIWDRVGFTDDEAFFRIEGGKRDHRLVYDPATGSGGFLVEAARRIRQEAHYNKKDFNDLVEIFTAVISGIYGSEIQAFPYYITEVNLLLQLTPVVKDMLETNTAYFQRDWALNVIQQDSLKLHNRVEPTLTNFDEELKQKDEVYEEDQFHDIIQLEGLKLNTYEFIKNHWDFDFVCANPPYIGEKGHKELFRNTIRNFPYWQQFYQGKMDYFYFFIELGLSKLRDGGKLGFITTAYWPTADGASKLRQYILDNAKIKEVIFFGEVKLFEYAKGQHNMVFVLEKCGNKEAREKNKMKVVVVKKEVEGRTVKDRLQKLVDHISKNISKKRYSDEYIDVFVSPVEQGELTIGAWNLTHSGDAEGILTKIRSACENLGGICNINSGADVTAASLTKSRMGLLAEKVISAKHLSVGDGIFVLSKRELEVLQPSSEEQKKLKPFIKNSDISRFFIAEHTKKYLIYLGWEDRIEDYPVLGEHLEVFRPILQDQVDRYEESYSWFALHRPRDEAVFLGEKLVNPQHSTEVRFAFADFPVYSSRDVYYTSKKEGVEESLKYLCGLLNSRLITFWLYHKGKRKGKSFELKTTPLSKIPVRRISFQSESDKKKHNTIVKLVDDVIDLKENLSQYEDFYPGVPLLDLETVGKLPQPSLESVVKELPKSKLHSLRTDTRIKYEPMDVKDFFLGKVDSRSVVQPDLSGKLQLKLVGKNRETILISGPKEILEYLAEVLTTHKGESWQEIKNKLLIPKKLGDLEQEKNKLEKTVASLIAKVANLQKKIDKEVYDLYGLTPEEIGIVEKNNE